jgi:ABC-2 type transport system permease protein
LTWRWTRFEVGLWLREPAAVLLNMAYPLIMLAFFMVALPELRTDGQVALGLAADLSLVGTMMVCLNFPATAIPEARRSDFYRYARTLPAGPGPRLVAWAAAPFLCGLASALVAAVVGALVTAAEPGPADLLAVMGGAVALAVPATSIGMALGFMLTPKSALAVALTAAFAMILFGGISGLPLPGWIDRVSGFAPPGAAADLMTAWREGGIEWRGIGVLIAWTVAGLAATLALYRRDEGAHHD